jgi:hypothetical protein
VFGISIEAILALSAVSLKPVEIFRFRQIINGDARAGVSVFRNGVWYLNRSNFITPIKNKLRY